MLGQLDHPPVVAEQPVDLVFDVAELRVDRGREAPRDRGLDLLRVEEGKRALERLSSAGLMQPLEGRSLVQRAVDRMMRDLAPRS